MSQGWKALRQLIESQSQNPLFLQPRIVTKIFFTRGGVNHRKRAAAPWDFHRKAALVSMPAIARAALSGANRSSAQQRHTLPTRRSLELLKQNEALSVARLLRPTQPVTLVRPHAARRAARFFLSKFPGTSMYAVKANPSADLIRTLWDTGLTHYDVASIAEVRLVARELPQATLCFMHPVKTPGAIAEAYRVAGRLAASVTPE